MSQRGLLVALAALAALLLVWTMAAWPSTPDTAASAASEQNQQPEDYQVPAPEPTILPPPAASSATAATTEQATPEDLEPEQQPVAQEAESAEDQADKLFVRENGPLAEYKEKFASEPRDSAASDAEVDIRSAFVPTDGPKPVMRSVLCRETICKIETRISSATLGAYVAAMTRIVHDKFDSKLATERTSLIENGEVSVVVYAKRPTPER